MSEIIKLQVKKVIKAKREKVFQAWTQPEIVKRWFAPGEMTVPDAQINLRIDGAFHIQMKGEMDKTPTAIGVYKKIISNELLIFTWSWEGNDSPETFVTVEFKDVKGGTEVVIIHERFADYKTRDLHKQGWRGCLENLTKRISQWEE